jgi:hypothetical protein
MRDEEEARIDRLVQAQALYEVIQRAIESERKERFESLRNLIQTRRQQDER